MSVESIQNTAQISGRYVIRAKREAQSLSQAQELQKASQNQNVQNESRASEIDTYDKDNPVGVQAEGVYSISHDESGNLKIDYTPKSESSEKSQADSESESSKSIASLKTEQPKSSGAGSASEVSSASSDDDDELEELQRQKNAIQQQISREQDENVKAELRVQLQDIEAQIIQLKTN